MTSLPPAARGEWRSCFPRSLPQEWHPGKASQRFPTSHFTVLLLPSVGPSKKPTTQLCCLLTGELQFPHLWLPQGTLMGLPQACIKWGHGIAQGSSRKDVVMVLIRKWVWGGRPARGPKAGLKGLTTNQEFWACSWPPLGVPRPKAQGGWPGGHAFYILSESQLP